MKKLLLITSVCVILTGCFGKNYTVKEFRENESLRKEYVDKCSNGELKKTEVNCINALGAEDLEKVHSQLKSIQSELNKY